jgi:CBS domain-containing protein
MAPEPVATFTIEPLIPERLREIAEQLRTGVKPEPKTVRQLLSVFNAERHGSYKVGKIRRALDGLGLVTDPDFENIWIDAAIEFRLRSEPHKESERAPDSTIAVPDVGEVREQLARPEPMTEIPVETPTVTSSRITDPTYRIGKLPAANQPIVSVTLDEDVTQAVTKMMKWDYSQLPIMQGVRDVKGVISWRSIGSRLALGAPCAKVRDCRDSHREVSADTSLFHAIPAIIEDGYVLVRADDKTISGIVTASDLSLQFQQLSEPFLLLGEIEQHVRKLIEGKFALSDLQDAKDPADVQRLVERVADLTLGEYIRLLENSNRWTMLKVNIDRAIFIAELKEVKRIRNDVMHFDPDPLGESELSTLRSFVRLLQRLDEILP